MFKVTWAVKMMVRCRLLAVNNACDVVPSCIYYFSRCIPGPGFNRAIAHKLLWRFLNWRMYCKIKNSAWLP